MKEEYADGIKIIKRKPRGRLLGIFIVSLCCVALVTILADIFSKTLNVGNFSLVSLILGDKNDKIEAHSYYAVTLGSYDTKNECLDVAMGSSVAGASGYVWESDGKFLPIGSIYKEKIDAENVKKQLENSVYDVQILEIKFKEIKFDESGKEEPVLSLIYESLNYLNGLFQNFSSHTIQLEKNEITYVAAASFINAYLGEIKVYESKMQYLIEEYGDETLKSIKNGFLSIESSLNNTISTLLSNFSPISDIKYGLADYVFNYYSLILSL